MMRVFYMRVVFALSTTIKVIFCRDSDLPSYRFKYLRAACFSYDVAKYNFTLTTSHIYSYGTVSSNFMSTYLFTRPVQTS